MKEIMMTQQDNDKAWNDTVSNPDLEGLETPATQQDPLAEDNDTPASPAEEPETPLAPDHPAMDSNMDQQEVYDAGPTTASSVNAQDETDEDNDQAITSTSQEV
jgi:hypothetical protein